MRGEPGLGGEAAETPSVRQGVTNRARITIPAVPAIARFAYKASISMPGCELKMDRCVHPAPFFRCRDQGETAHGPDHNSYPRSLGEMRKGEVGSRRHRLAVFARRGKGKRLYPHDNSSWYSSSLGSFNLTVYRSISAQRLRKLVSVDVFAVDKEVPGSFIPADRAR